jgi:hypothetical protein
MIPASLEVVSGQQQSGTVGAELAQPIVVRVLNSAGDPVGGQVVNFHVVKGDGSVFAGVAITNADGVAQERWTLGKSVADSQVVEARAVDASTGEALVFGRFVATPVAGAPVILEKSRGDEQTGNPGVALPDSLLVRLADAYGNPVPGVAVSWTVVSGDGATSKASDVTTASGYATTKWTLGPAEGRQSVRALVGTDLSAVFAATSILPPPLVVAVYAGNNQTAAPGSAVAVAPAVRVSDNNGLARSGETVTFAVTGGGGTITGATAVTDAQGVARVGSWVLGSTTGVNTLTATIAGGASVTFNASAVQASPGISVVIEDPAGDFVGDTVYIRVSAVSNTQISTVRAVLAGRTVNLAHTGIVWTGTLLLVGAPQDTMTLVATATDVNGNSAQALRALIHDLPPSITVSSPVDGSVARPTTQVDAVCADEDGHGCNLSVLADDGSLLIGPTPSAIHTSVSLAAFEGRNVGVIIVARDSRDKASSITRHVWVESSPHLQLLGSAEGEVKAVSGTRLLWSSGSTVGIRQVGGNSETITSTVQGELRSLWSFLTPSGAVFSTSFSTAPYAQLYVWRNGSLTTKNLNSSTSLAASGNYAIYSVPPFGSGPLYRMDVVTGAEVLVASSSGNTENDVSENGDVVYWNGSYDIFRYRSSTITPITSDDDAVRWNTYPVTDGINVVFRRHPPCCATPQPMEIWMFDGSSLSMLAPAGHSDVSPRTNYAVNAGWTAFTKDDASANAQIWTRSPTGTLRAVSDFATSSWIAALGSDGSVVFDNPNGRYLAGPSSAPIRIGSTSGTVAWDQDHFVVLLGNSAFTVTP